MNVFRPFKLFAHAGSGAVFCIRVLHGFAFLRAAVSLSLASTLSAFGQLGDKVSSLAIKFLAHGGLISF